MRIVLILPGNGRSGGVRCTVIVANQLIKRGHSVRILYRRVWTSPKQMIVDVVNRRFYSDCCDWLETFCGVISSYRKISECVFDRDEIIVGVGMWCSAELGKLNHVGNSKLQYIHGLSPWMPDVMNEALSLPLPKIAVSSHVAEKIKSYNSGDLLATIHNGIDRAEYYPGVDERHRNGIGTVYSSHPAKNPEIILRVLTKLKEEMPDVHQYIFGADRRPKRIPKMDYKRYPSVEEARYRYSCSKVWFLASNSEGFPGTVLEAMACGCAVVATDCGGPRDIIVDGENGFLAEVGNVKEIVSKIKLLLDNEDLRQRMAKNAIETIKGFSWDVAVSELERILQKIDSSKE
jgi:glycosyltransferase involved in cell wall biosynthesis